MKSICELFICFFLVSIGTEDNKHQAAHYADSHRVRNALNYASFEKFESKRNFQLPVDQIDLVSEDENQDVCFVINFFSKIHALTQLFALNSDGL